MKVFQNKWLFTLIILAIILFVIYIFRKVDTSKYSEGFTQDVPFLLKTNDRIYDSFYAMIYDDLYMTSKTSDYQYKKIIEMTQPSKEKSVFLDVGSGTGHLVNNLTKSGYEAYGIDKSQAMIDVSDKIFPNIEVKCGDITNPMSFDKGSLTHITCMDFTVYELENKQTFFNNCYYWLKPNGYLIIHLVDKQRFSPITPAGNPLVNDNPQKYTPNRIKNTKIDFLDFEYTNKYDFSKNDDRVVKTETFTDYSTRNVRQNEITLKMEDIDSIVYMIRGCGFIAHSQIALPTDEYQYIYIFERVM